MNNIQKAFKNKAKLSLRMAAGGLIDPVDYSDNSIAGLQKRTAAVQSASSAPSGSVALMPDTSDMENAEKTARWRQDDLLKQASYSANPEPLQRAAAASATPLQIGQMNSPTDALNAERTQRWRQDDLLDKTQYFTMPSRRGLRMAEGGIVRGEGGPTDDKVPMQVAGRNVHLSNTEAVLPAKTVAALGGPEAIEELIEQTNGKPPVKGGLRAGGAYATGVAGDQIDPRELRPEFRSQAATPVIEPAANPGLEAARNTRAANVVAGAQDAAELPAGLRAAGMQPAQVAGEAAAAAPKVGMGARALGILSPVGEVAGGVMAAKGLSDFVNSFPSLRGQHTAEATDMTLAGTPQQDAVEKKAVAAVDANWEKQHGQKVTDPMAATRAASAKILADGQSAGTVDLPQIDRGEARRGVRRAQSNGRQGAWADAEAAMSTAGNIPGQNHKPEAVTLDDTQRSFDLSRDIDRRTGTGPGLRAGSGSPGDLAFGGMQKRFDAYRNDPSLLADRNEVERLRGSGARIGVGKDGGIMITNSGDFDGSTKMAYTDKNGNPTAIHTGSQQHLQGLRDAQNQRDQLAVYEQNRLKRNAGEDITDEGLRARSQQALDTQGRQAAELTKAQIARAPTALDIDKHRLAQDQFNLDRQKADNTQENAVRNFKASQSAQVTKLIDSALDNQSPTAGLKDDELKKAQARRADLEMALYSAPKRLPGDEAEYALKLPGMMRQAKLSVAMRDAIQNRGLWNKITNLGRDPWQTLNAAAPKRVGDNFVFDNNFSIPVKDVIGKDADLLNAYNERVNTR